MKIGSIGLTSTLARQETDHNLRSLTPNPLLLTCLVYGPSIETCEMTLSRGPNELGESFRRQRITSIVSPLPPNGIMRFFWVNDFSGNFGRRSSTVR